MLLTLTLGTAYGGEETERKKKSPNIAIFLRRSLGTAFSCGGQTDFCRATVHKLAQQRVGYHSSHRITLICKNEPELRLS